MITYALTSSAFNINLYVTSGMGGYIYLKGHKIPPKY